MIKVSTRVLIFFLALVITGCLSLNKVNRTFIPPGSVKQYTTTVPDSELADVMKAHLRNGETRVYRSYIIDTLTKTLKGDAVTYNYFREKTSTGYCETHFDSIVILEANSIRPTNRLLFQKIMFGVTLGIGAICITQPKACFGSCPTFYLDGNDSGEPVAEGFSSSIAPSLEKTDIDHLYGYQPAGDEMVIDMKNEALETHVVDYVNLLAVQRKAKHRVYQNAYGGFLSTSEPLLLCSAQGPEGNISSKLLNVDKEERFSLADESYLAAKETLEVDFEAGKMKAPGLVISCRQTLLPTYLLYQVLAYMGSESGFWLANLERNKLGKEKNSLLDLMGDIDIYQQNLRGEWVRSASVGQHGPLASDCYVVPLRVFNSTNARIRLVMSKGTWRIGYCGLVEIKESVKPLVIEPITAENRGFNDNEALRLLQSENEKLVTLPGDAYTLRYPLPNAPRDYEYFLESKGYYLEWTRKEWAVEENQKLLLHTFTNPEAALRRLAPEFKKAEPEMETIFWNSKYAR